MIKLKLAIELNYTIAEASCDFIFNIHAAQTRCQSVLHEDFSSSQPVLPKFYTDPASSNRYARMRGNVGPLVIRYNATVAIAHHTSAPEFLAETPVEQLPEAVLCYLYPSRYCQSDRLYKFAISEFGQLPHGYARVDAIQNWVRKYITFTPRVTSASTSAIDTLVERVGVCRDFAHLMIALCRALNIPARFTTGIDYGADPALGPPDFHAYVEVYLSGRWYIFDPSGLAMPMGFVRFGTGRDAADAAFATLFGSVQSLSPLINAEALLEPGCTLPFHSRDALSTDGL